MDINPEQNTHANRLAMCRRVGLGLFAGSLLVGYLDEANQSFVGGLDVHPVYYAPIVLTGLTLALSACLGQREQRQQ